MAKKQGHAKYVKEHSYSPDSWGLASPRISDLMPMTYNYQTNELPVGQMCYHRKHGTMQRCERAMGHPGSHKDRFGREWY